MLKLFAFTQAFAASEADGLRRRQEGQTMAEYGVMLAVITPALIAALTVFSTSARHALETIASILPR